MPIYEDSKQVVEVSESGVVQSWRINGIDIFYPRERVMQDDIIEWIGGVCVYFPNNLFYKCSDVLLERRNLKFVVGIMNIGNNDTFLSVECKVSVCITLHNDGFEYKLFAKLLEPCSEDIFINPAFCVYIRTHEEIVVVQSPDVYKYIGGHENLERCSESISKNSVIGVATKSIGCVKMQLSGNMWLKSIQHEILLRHSPDYLCIEPKTCGGSRVHLRADRYMKFGCRFRYMG